MKIKLDWRSFTKTFISVVGGNVIYFSIQQHLPVALRHKPFYLDWGIVTDFWMCLVLWGLIDGLQKIGNRLKGF
jgi:hypothetical protein